LEFAGGAVAPGRMDCADRAEFEGEGKLREPVDPLLHVLLADLVEGGLVLGGFGFVVRTERESVGADRVVAHGVDLVVAEDRERVSGLDHGPHGFEHFADFRSPVDVVSEEDDLAALGVGVAAVEPLVAQLGEHGVEFVRVAVDVSDEVVGLVVHLLSP